MKLFSRFLLRYWRTSALKSRGRSCCYCCSTHLYLMSLFALTFIVFLPFLHSMANLWAPSPRRPRGLSQGVPTCAMHKNGGAFGESMSNEQSLSPSSLASGSSTPCGGLSYLRDPRLSKELAFPTRERESLKILGLLPPRVKTQAQQAALALRNVRSLEEPLAKYQFLMDLAHRNERLFFKILTQQIQEFLPIVYTPTVGLACQKFSQIFTRPVGLFISINDRGRISEIIRNWPEEDVRGICVTDGGRILGLGDLGANGMGIPVGKLSLYTALAGIKPHQLLPITLDVGTNNQALLEDPDYIGLPKKRVADPEYLEFMDEFMDAVVARFGQRTLIQFEDFGNQNAFRLLERYRDRYCTFNDDIQGTAAVAVAGIIAATRHTGTKLSNNTFLFHGAGSANIGIAKLLLLAMEEWEGVPRSQGLKRIWMNDSRGLIVKDRPSGGITSEKASFAQEHEPLESLLDIVDSVKPTALIGATAQGGVFTQDVVEGMARHSDRPIIFALSNPTNKAECTAEQAYTWTGGRALFASGSPFPSVLLKLNTSSVLPDGKATGTEMRSFEPGQGNNAYIFPGVALAAISFEIQHISEDIFLASAEALADLVTAGDLAVGRLYPSFDRILECSAAIATRVGEVAYRQGVARLLPEPQDKLAHLRQQLYRFDYDDEEDPAEP